MAPEEAQKVKAGDHLVTRIGKKYRVVVVTMTHTGIGNHVYGFRLRKKGAKEVDRLGNPTTTIYRTIYDVGWAADHECRKDVVKANVYADWLEENGFEDAAAFLRAEFPVGLPGGDNV